MLLKTLANVLAAVGLLNASPHRAAAADQPAPVQHVYVMRHLQKAPGDDPALTKEGALLADLLAGQLGNFGIKAVFATPTRRATQTGEPLARFLRIPVTPYDPRDVPALVAAVKAVPGDVLVVGHSNTVPDLVAALGGTRPAPIGESQYGTIYQVTDGSPDVRLLSVPMPPVPASPATERGSLAALNPLRAARP
jgi:phosphohistidine phosphatase SixA